ncbi:hypothetical protein [Chromatium okenii]|jgi:hypothetical protein|uniref:hypothetical protein n=1 Tax=Chromatium okenii TaxID=61644 RepID=UPI0026F0ECC9|nr:hypothetical protein [Chromatium okenii]MBV5311545.1 hypothetical protein [Chromatium okenii]
MASSITAYDHFWKLVTTGGLDLDTSEIRIRLVTSNYGFNVAHTTWDNGLDNATDPSFNEVATGAGYTTGGIALSGAVVTNGKIDYADITWPELTKTFRAAIAVGIGTFGGVVDPVLFYLLPDTTPADIVSNGSDYSILWNDVDGLFYRPTL